MRAPVWVYAAWAVSLPVLYTEPTAAQIPPNFPFQASARPSGRPLDGDALGWVQGYVDVHALQEGGVVMPEAVTGR